MEILNKSKSAPRMVRMQLLPLILLKLMNSFSPNNTLICQKGNQSKAEITHSERLHPKNDEVFLIFNEWDFVWIEMISSLFSKIFDSEYYCFWKSYLKRNPTL